MSKVEEYRSYAAHFLKLAETCKSPRDKRLLLAIAQGWVNLAAGRPGAWMDDPDRLRSRRVIADFFPLTERSR
jgi:hypothetical protein